MSWLSALRDLFRREPPAPWIGSCLRDRERDKAFGSPRYTYPKRKEK